MRQNCNIYFFADNEFTLQPLKSRNDDETKKRTLFIRDLPLDVNKSLLKIILEEKFGHKCTLTYFLKHRNRIT